MESTRLVRSKWTLGFVCAIMLICAAAIANAQNALGAMVDEVDDAEQRLLELPAAQRLAGLVDLRNKVQEAMATAGSNAPGYTPALLELADLNDQVGDYPQAESEYLSASKCSDGTVTLQMHALLNAYTVAVKAARDPEEIAPYLARLEDIYSQSKAQLGDQRDAWERIMIGLGGLRSRADLAYGEALAKGILASGKLDAQVAANVVREKWFGAAIGDYDGYVGALHSAMAKHQAEWLRTNNMLPATALFSKAQLIQMKVSVLPEGDNEKAELVQSYYDILKEVVNADGASTYAQHAAAALFEKASAEGVLDGKYASELMNKLAPCYEPLIKLQELGVTAIASPKQEEKDRANDLLDVVMVTYAKWFPKSYKGELFYQQSALSRAQYYLEVVRLHDAEAMVNLVPHPIDELKKQRQYLIQAIEAKENDFDNLLDGQVGGINKETNNGGGAKH